MDVDPLLRYDLSPILDEKGLMAEDRNDKQAEDWGEHPQQLARQWFWVPMLLGAFSILLVLSAWQQTSPEQVIFYAEKMGIGTPLRPYPTLAIGTSEVRLVDLVSAYTTFPNGGIHIAPRFVTKVVDRYGNVLEENRVVDKQVVLTAELAYMMVSLMQSTLDHPRGTGRGARYRGFLRPAGGKTGTSDSFCLTNWNCVLATGWARLCCSFSQRRAHR